MKVDSPKSGGTWEKMQFDATFKRLSQSDLKVLLDTETGDDQKFCRAVLAGWKGIQTEDKQDVPFSEAALDQLLDMPRVAAAIASAYLSSVAGAASKN
ncbi:MAG: hypothetical protein EOP89_07930 [Lysobacteraceae bacterium]|nr:MAG: hypothetical protein EOP89_07930 [Xanthomonadaceae bacterium]